MAIKVPNPIWM